MKCGDVCLVNYPFTDGSAAKVRPVVIISADRYNAHSDIVVLPISSNPRMSGTGELAIAPTDSHFAKSGLNRASVIKCLKPLTIAKSKLQRKLGTLDESLLTAAREHLANLFSIDR